jgi:hypothetical protein
MAGLESNAPNLYFPHSQDYRAEALHLAHFLVLIDKMLEGY